MNGILSTGDNAEWIAYLFILMAFIRSIEKSNAYYFQQTEKRRREKTRKICLLHFQLILKWHETNHWLLILRSSWTNDLLWNFQRKKAQHHTENYAQLIKS